jgi:ISXO2-like transposase domain
LRRQKMPRYCQQSPCGCVAVSLNEGGHPISMNMPVVKGLRLAEMARWAKQYVKLGSTVFSAVIKTGCSHISIVTGGVARKASPKEFTWVNTIIGNVKNAITGTYHAINLRGFCYRHNRRFQLENMLSHFTYVSLRTPLCQAGF